MSGSARRSGGVARSNGIELCYETLGDPADPALLLLMGHGVQLTGWEPSFVEGFVEAGFFVIRFDNRDVGLSTDFDGLLPDIARARLRDRSGAVYGLEDMADDAAGLLDALDVRSAHVLGASMGGMIAQILAVRHPARVRSLCSIMSTTGAPDVGRPRPEALAILRSGTPSSRGEVVAAQVAVGRALAGSGFPFDESRARAQAERSYDRRHYPEGKLRQQAAVLVAADRTSALGGLRVPTVVIHGSEDPLVGVDGGEATAAAIPDARLVVVSGLGHEFPAGVQDTVIAEVAATARRSAP
ncbi:MAG: alpha/beta fold hydrolase [Pseudonocardia sp.]|nr:alpha/beta fold hydrolase [Pseudonocardia sp.]